METARSSWACCRYHGRAAACGSRTAKGLACDRLAFSTIGTSDQSRGSSPAGLREIGYVEDESFTAEYRAADGHYDGLPALAQDLVQHQVDLIMTLGGTPTALAAKNATSTIPIVFTNVSDPVSAGLVASLASRRQRHWGGRS